MTDKTNVVVGNFGKPSEVDEALKEVKDRNLDEVIIIGFKDGYPHLISTPMYDENPFSVIGFMDFARDLIKMDLFTDDEQM